MKRIKSSQSLQEVWRAMMPTSPSKLLLLAFAAGKKKVASRNFETPCPQKFVFGEHSNALEVTNKKHVEISVGQYAGGAKGALDD